MGYEDIEIRITRTGEILVKIDGATEEKLRDYRLFLEETVGPVQAEQVQSPDWERPAGLSTEQGQDSLEQSHGG